MNKNISLFIIIYLTMFSYCYSNDSILNVEITSGYSSILMKHSNVDMDNAINALIFDGYTVQYTKIDHSYDFSIKLSKSFDSQIGTLLPYVEYSYLAAIIKDTNGFWSNGELAYQFKIMNRASFLSFGFNYGIKFKITDEASLFTYFAPEIGLLSTYGHEEYDQYQSDGTRFYGFYREYLFLESLFPAYSLQVGIIGQITKYIALVINGGYRFAHVEQKYKYTEDSDILELNTINFYDLDYSGWFIKAGFVLTIK